MEFGNYELETRIAEGGMAEVWRARARGAAGFEKTVVIKRVLPSLMRQRSFADLLVREAKIASRLAHANIAQIFDLGEQDGAYFIVMEYVDGVDLSSIVGREIRLRSGRREATTDRPPAATDLPLPLHHKLFILRETARALDFAHRRRGEDGKPLGIVHRDISPHNVLISREGEVKVTDFGIARADEEGLGRDEDPRILRGKYAYMSPEQSRGEPLDARSDVFAWGIVAYELLFGVRLFRGMTPKDTLRMVRETEAPSYAVESFGGPRALRTVLEGALQKNRDMRPSSSELSRDVDSILRSLGAPTGPAELALELGTLFPVRKNVPANKFYDDFLARLEGDSLNGVSAVQLDARRENTAVSITGPTHDAHARLVVAVRAAAFDEPTVRRVVEDFGGKFVSHENTAFGAFDGAHAGVIVLSAVRAALRIKRALRDVGYLRLVQVSVFESHESGAGDAVAAKWSDQVDRLRGEVGQEAIAVQRKLTQGLEDVLRVGPSPNAEVNAVLGERLPGEIADIRARGGVPLVGRRGVFEHITTLLASSIQESVSQCAVLRGEAGVGKTRIVSALESANAVGSARIVCANAYGSDERRSFSLLAELVRQLAGIDVDDAPRTRLQRISQLRFVGASDEDQRVLGELVDVAFPLPVTERDSRPRALDIVAALRRVVVGVAREQPLVIVIEDLHRTDDSSWHALPLLVAPVRAPVLFLLTARSEAPMPTISHTHGRRGSGRAANNVHPIELGRLTDDESIALFTHGLGAQRLDPRLASLMLHEVRGNPAQILEYASALTRTDGIYLHHGVARRTHGVEGSVEGAFSHEVELRLSNMPAGTRAVLVTAALRRDWVPTNTLEAMFPDAPLPSILQHLSQAKWIEGSWSDLSNASTRKKSSRGTLTPRPEYTRKKALSRMDAIRVRGNYARRAILRVSPPQEVRDLAMRTRDAAKGRGDTLDLETQARFAAMSDDWESALELRSNAAHAAEKEGDFEAAFRNFRAAAEAAKRTTTRAAEESQLLLHAAAIAHAAGEPLVARATALLVPDTVSGDVGSRRSLALAQTGLEAGDYDGAREVIEHAVAKGAKDPVLRTLLLLTAARALCACGRPETAIIRLRDAAADAPDALLSGRVYAALCEAHARLGDVVAARAALDQAYAASTRSGNPELRLRTMAASGWVAIAEDQRGVGANHFADAVKAADELGELSEAARLRGVVAWLSARAGDLDAATRWATEGLRQARVAVDPDLELELAGFREAASPDEADRDHARAWLSEATPSFVVAAALETLALSDVRSRHKHAAVGAYSRASEAASRAGFPHMARRLGRAGEVLSISELDD